MPHAPLGQILVGRSLLQPQQLEQLLQLQQTDSRPLGAIAADYFGVCSDVVCDALAEQMLPNCPRTNLANEAIDPNCLFMVTPHQAWNAILLPLRVEDGALICATTVETLGNALHLMQDKTSIAVRFVIVPIRQLEQYVCQYYDYEGLDVTEEVA